MRGTVSILRRLGADFPLELIDDESPGVEVEAKEILAKSAGVTAKGSSSSGGAVVVILFPLAGMGGVTAAGVMAEGVVDSRVDGMVGDAVVGNVVVSAWAMVTGM